MLCAGTTGRRKQFLFFIEMIVVQELSGETLFKLSQEVLSLDTATLWHETHVVVLQDFIRFDKDLEVVFSGREVLNSGETYMTLLKNAQRRNSFKIVIEVHMYMLEQLVTIGEALEKVYKFVKKHKLYGIKFCLCEDSNLHFTLVNEIVNVLRNSDIVNEDWFFLLSFHEQMFKYPGLIHRLACLADYVLFPVQGYFEHRFLKEIYGTKFEKLLNTSDRRIEKVLAHLNHWVIQGIPRFKLLAYIATTGVVMESNINDYVYNVYEVPRSGIYRKICAGLEIEEEGCSVYFDTQEAIYEKVSVLMNEHQFAGVCMQDLNYDLLWLDRRSVFGVVKMVQNQISTARVSSPPPSWPDRRDDTLQVVNNAQEFPNTTSVGGTR